MQKYTEAFEILQEYIEEYKKILTENKLNKFNAPLLLQYRSEIQDLIDFFQENKEETPFSIYQDFQKEIILIQEYDQKLIELIPQIKTLINLNHYKNKYPKHHTWWYM